MRLIVNGTVLDTPAADLTRLIEALELDPSVVATAVNGDFVPRGERQAVTLHDGDHVEILSPRQGG
jgi:sulfur carrier protein